MVAIDELSLFMDTVDWEGTRLKEQIDENVSKAVEAGESLREVIRSGTDQEKEAAKLFQLLLEYKRLSVYLTAGFDKEYLGPMAELEPSLQAYHDQKRYPIVFFIRGERKAVNYSLYRSIVSNYYPLLCESASMLGRQKEMVEYCRLAANTSYADPWFRYVSAIRLQQVLGRNGYPPNLRMEAFAQGMEAYRKLDSISRKRAAAARLSDLGQMADSVLVTSRQGPKDQRWKKAALMAVRHLGGEYEEASSELMSMVLSENGKSRYELERLYRFSDSMGLNPAKSQALGLWEALGPSGQPTVASLRATLDALLEAASANGETLKKISKGSFSSRYNNGKLRGTSICLSGAVECFTTEYENKVSRETTRYWYSVVASEPASSLKGRLRGLYEEMCGELGMIHRDKPMEYDYNNTNYYKIKISPTCEALLSYYFNSISGTDVILLQAKFVD